jgi:hypothetical protein
VAFAELVAELKIELHGYFMRYTTERNYADLTAQEMRSVYPQILRNHPPKSGDNLNRRRRRFEFAGQYHNRDCATQYESFGVLP